MHIAYYAFYGYLIFKFLFVFYFLNKEEADVLSDRIAIMNHGQIKCCGSPLFLKNTFGSGYRVSIAKNENFVQTRFFEFISKHVEKYVIETNIAAELSISVPYSLSSKLPLMLKEMENNKSNYGIDGYGVSSPTIEEIFIKYVLIF